jgi:glucose/arabinose dehydrogenase
MTLTTERLCLIVLFAGGCAKRSVDEGKRPIEQAAPAPAMSTASPAPASDKPPVKTRDLCRGERLPPDQHYVPEGLCAVAVATGQGPLRDIDFAPNGDLVGVRQNGAVVRYRDIDESGAFEGNGAEIVEWGSLGGSGHNCTFADDFLYCGSKNGVVRFRYGDGNTQAGPAEEVIADSVGHGGASPYSVRAYDGMLYVAASTADGFVSPLSRDYDRERAVVKRFRIADFADKKPVAWKNGELFVSGARSAVAMARGPRGRLYAAIDNFDDVLYAGVDVHADNPGEGLVSLEKGKRYGFPFCFHAARVVQNGNVVPPGTPLRADVKNELGGVVESNKDDAWCGANTDRPLSFFQAHTSVLDLEFVPGTSTGLPARYAGGLLAALHGSRNRDSPTGYKVVWLPLDAEGNATMPTSTVGETRYPYEVVFGGGKRGAHRDGPWSWKGPHGGETTVRPVGLAISPTDGALYVSSDNAPVGLSLPVGKPEGAIYRIAVER